MATDDRDIHLGYAAENDKDRRQYHHPPRLTKSGEQDDKGDYAAHDDLAEPEYCRERAAMEQDKALNTVTLSDLQIRQEVDNDEIEHRRDENTKQVAQPPEHYSTQFPTCPAHGSH